jgi:hypothetical protein
MENVDHKLVFDWMMLAFITAGIAQGKNRSGMTWGLLSVLLGPLALAALVLFADKIEKKV